MKLFRIVGLLLFIFQVSNAQNQPFYKTYNWDNNPSYTVDTNSEESIIGVKEKIVTEFIFDGNDGLVEYFLEHKVYWLNSDDKIEEFNKVYLPYSSDSNLEINKARVITKAGKVIELDESKILTATNDETNRTYKYFAFEGIEKGSFIEYMYVVKRYPAYKGKRITFQSSFNKTNIEFDLFSPNNLVFKFKSYNDLPNAELDTLSENKLHWKLSLPKLKKLENEELSAYNASRQYIVYKLHSNTASNTKDISSYSNASKNIYSFYNSELSKKTKNAIKKFLKAIPFKENSDESSKLRALEFYIKSNIFIAESGSEELKDIDKILSQKVANEVGIIKLYVALFNQLNIKHQIVFTTDRSELKFDKNFEANNFLIDVLLYFPKSKSYMSPSEMESRLGFPPANLTDNYGLFIKEVKLGDFKSAVGKIKYIKPVSEKETYDKMIVDVDFDEEDLSTINIRLDKSMNGYYSMNIQPFLDLVKPEDKIELIESFAKNLDEDADIKDKKIVNDNPRVFGIEPLQIIIDFKSEAFVEKAGRKYLFKLGDLIGQQMQLYQEKERILPLENRFKRSYYRTINVTIPKGYKIVNLDDINIDNSYSKDGKELLSFKSFYTVKDNVVSITADEHYRINFIDTSIYEEYRTVINSAADFNKITLVLEPIE